MGNTEDWVVVGGDCVVWVIEDSVAGVSVSDRRFGSVSNKSVYWRTALSSSARLRRFRRRGDGITGCVNRRRVSESDRLSDGSVI